MNRVKKFAAVIVGLAIVATAVASQTVRYTTPVDHYSITGYPYYGAVVTPNDSTDVDPVGYIRADAAGAVTAACMGNGAGNQITLNLDAGDFFPCLVTRVYDTGTDAITIHIFY